MPRVVKLGGTGPNPAEKTSPNALKKIERIEPRAQKPRQLSADDKANLGLVARKSSRAASSSPRWMRARNPRTSSSRASA